MKQASMFSEIWKTLSLLFESFMLEASELTAKIALIKSREEGESDLALYFRGLKRITLFVILFPIPILLFGIVKHMDVFVSIAGLCWAIPTTLLFALASPIGLLLSAITGRVQETVTRYIKFAQTTLLVELTFTLVVSVVPIENNLGMLPVAIVAAAILGILSSMGIKTRFSKRAIAFFAANVLTVFLFSCFFPTLAVKIKERVTETLTRGVEDLLAGQYPWISLPEQPPADTVLYVNAGEVKPSIHVNDHTCIYTNATHAFKVVGGDGKGSIWEYPVKSGESMIDYTQRNRYNTPSSEIWMMTIKGEHDGTVIAMNVFRDGERTKQLLLQ